ncbi:S9 family peptidase, partial [Pseudomonas syringae pv. tagetis]
ASPIISADGQRLAWIEWQRPHQPWTSTRLKCAAKQDDGHWASAQCEAGNGAQESLQQPRIDAHGRLYCLTERAGVWQP